MRTICTILALMLLLAFPAQYIEAGTKTTKNVVVKKYKRENLDDKKGPRTSPCPIYCNFSMEDGIQLIDTSDIYLYEVWNASNTLMTVSFADEALFVRYVLECSSQCTIKMHTPDYIYIGHVDITDMP